jgi:gliding motility-associated-like protein
MKQIFIVFLLLLTQVLFSQNYVIELCKGDTIKNFYVDNFEYFTTIWEVTPPTSVLYQDDSQIVLLLNQEGLYNLSVYYANNNCKTDNTSVVIKVISCLDSYVWIPNAFTPNEDNLNDYFHIKTINITDYHLMIFNRWGELIFESFNPTYLWNGRTKDNNMIMEGVYVYKFTYKDSKYKLKQVIGRVTLVNL